MSEQTVRTGDVAADAGGAAVGAAAVGTGAGGAGSTPPGDRARSATIFDVARLAGVSHQTVSRVLNDLPNVRPATRERVEKAIRQLRYVPSQAARALVTRRSRTIGVLATGLPDYGPTSIVLAVTASARDAGYAVISTNLADSTGPGLRSAAEMLIRQNVEAIVLVVSTRAELEAFEDAELGVPLVAASSQSAGRATTVTVDQYAGARTAVSHLIAEGHRDIRHIAGPVGSMDAEERIRGWRERLEGAGLPIREPERGDWTPESGYRIGRAMLAGAGAGAIAAGEIAADPEARPDGIPSAASLPDAVFVGNDQMALGLLHAIDEAGLSVPGDISVVGFDDIPEAAHFTPPLTTIRQDFALLGRDAMACVLVLLDEDSAGTLPHSRAPSLITRASTAPAR